MLLLSILVKLCPDVFCIISAADCAIEQGFHALGQFLKNVERKGIESEFPKWVTVVKADIDVYAFVFEAIIRFHSFLS